MDWSDFLTAFGLMLVFEGIMPFLNPSKWRQLIGALERMSDLHLRVGSLLLMLGGVLLIYIVKNIESL